MCTSHGFCLITAGKGGVARAKGVGEKEPVTEEECTPPPPVTEEECTKGQSAWRLCFACFDINTP